MKKELLEAQARERELVAQLVALRKDQKKPQKDFFGNMFKRDKSAAGLKVHAAGTAGC